MTSFLTLLTLLFPLTLSDQVDIKGTVANTLGTVIGGIFLTVFYFAIAQKFREAGIEFPFPQRDLHFRDGVLKVENVTAEANAERTQA